MGHYGQHAIQPAAQNPMFISSEVHVNHTDVHIKDRSGCASCMDRLISGLYYRAKHQAHFAIAKALFTPIVAMICIILGQLLQRKASLSKEEYQASMLNSLLAAFVGGHCLVGSVIILNIMLDTQPSPGRLWHRYFTFTSMLILFATGAAAGPLGVKIMEDSNMIVLDPRHAFYSSGLGAGLIFWILVIVKALLLSEFNIPSMPVHSTRSSMIFFRPSKTRYP